MSQRLAILFLLLFLAGSSTATTYYVSAHGADLNDGLSAATPFAHHPWDNQATDIADATTLRPGDIVYMKRGHIWYNCSINVEDSGVNGNPIVTTTLDGFGFGDNPKLVGAYNPSSLSFAPDGGGYKATGIAAEPRIVVYNGTGYNWRVLARRDSAKSSVVAGEWDWDEDGGRNSLWINVGEDPNTGTVWAARRNVVALVSGCSNVSFSNLDFCVSQSGSSGTVYVASFCSNITFDSCGCAYGFAGINASDSSSLTIRNCRVWDWTQGAGVFLTNCGDSLIERCLIDGGNLGVTGIRLHNSSGNSIQACHLQDCWNGLEYGHGGDGSGIMVSGSSGSNSIAANTLLGCYAGMILKSASGTGDNALAYNFVVNSRVNGISITSNGIALPEQAYCNMVVHNPSDHDPTDAVNYTGHGIVIQSTGAKAVFNSNTIFVSRAGEGCDNCNGLCISDTSSNIVEVRTDYNVLFGVRDAYVAKLVDAGGAHMYRTVKEWQAAIQADPKVLDLDGKSAAAGAHDTGADTGWARPSYGARISSSEAGVPFEAALLYGPAAELAATDP
ncbi:MAG: right-handed parallel beta-helix repeat-containing protein [Phycisphaerales bacterium]